MIKRKFGWTNVDVPLIGQGTWMIESGIKIESDLNNVIKCLQTGIDYGMTHIDTAEMYGNGKVEELVGQAIAGRREEIFLVSKVLPSNASYEGTIKSCKRSLSNLKTDYLDLYLLHWPSSYPINETMHAMEKLVAEGLIKYIGVSNFNLKELQMAEHALQKERIACNQVLYNLGYRAVERNILPYCIKQEIALVGYSPFGHGIFPSVHSENGRVLSNIAKQHDKTPKQVALNFLSTYSNIFAIPKTSHIERVKENCESVGWNLTEEEIREINKSFPVSESDTYLEMI